MQSVWFRFLNSIEDYNTGVYLGVNGVNRSQGMSLVIFYVCFAMSLVSFGQLFSP